MDCLPALWVVPKRKQQEPLQLVWTSSFAIKIPEKVAGFLDGLRALGRDQIDVLFHPRPDLMRGRVVLEEVPNS